MASPRSRAVGGVEHAQHGVLGAALARADGDERSVGRRLVPVDGVGGVGRCRSPGRAARPAVRVGIDGRTPGQQELLGAGRALERRTGGRRGPARPSRPARCINATRRSCHQPRSGRASSACRVCSFWAATHCVDLGGVAVLQPPVGVGDLDAVEGVDDVVAPGGRRRRGHRRSGVVVSEWSASPHVGALAVVGLGPTQPGLALLGLLRHRRASLRAGLAQSGRESSMAATSVGSSGVTIGPKRVIEPSASTRNFSKFQRMSPSCALGVGDRGQLLVDRVPARAVDLDLLEHRERHAVGRRAERRRSPRRCRAPGHRTGCTGSRPR